MRCVFVCKAFGSKNFLIESIVSTKNVRERFVNEVMVAEHWDIGVYARGYDGTRAMADSPARLESMSDSVEERILRSLRRISRALELHSKQLEADVRLTAPQLICLRELRDVGRTTPSELAQAVSLSQATITGILDRLESRGLVARARNPRDKRRVLCELTEAGRAAVESAPLPLHARFAARLAKLTDEERTQIETVLARIVRMMEAEAIDAAPMLVGGPMSDDPEESGGGPSDEET